MRLKIAAITLVVRDYDEALSYFTQKLGFVVLEDTPMSSTKRWVVVAPPGDGPRLLLARAANADQQAHIGNQTGGRVFLFLHTDDFWRDYRLYQANGVDFIEEPREEPYGIVVVFRDLNGNLWDLVQPR